MAVARPAADEGPLVPLVGLPGGPDLAASTNGTGSDEAAHAGPADAPDPDQERLFDPTPYGAHGHGAPLLDRPAPRIHLPDQRGGWVDVPSFMGRRVVLIAFLRHLGCPFCKRSLRQLRRLHGAFTEAGVQIVAVVPAALHELAAFRPARRAPFPVLSDLPGDTFRAFGVPLGSWSAAWGARSGWNILGAALHGFLPGRMGRRRGTPRQLSGCFLIDQLGIVRFAWTGDHQGDDVEWALLLARVRRLGETARA